MITIIAIGKKHESWVLPGIERYQKRLRSPYDCTWRLLPHSSLNGDEARAEESISIAKCLNADDTVVLLDETGVQLSSPDLAILCDQQFTSSKRLVIVIGGAYGVDDQLKARADIVWSLSPLVFPHQLVRLILIEQVYRAQEISKGGQYHHV